MSKRINELFFARPWAIKEDVLMILTEIIGRHLKGEKLSIAEIESRIEAKVGSAGKKSAPDYEVINGTARIPIYGVISKRSSAVKNISGPEGTSVLDIEKNFKAALSDPAVNKILLDVDSPGGNADGVAELSDLIYNARGKKPITAFANGQMDSAAYWLGSAADKIYASKSAEVGSIGVYTVINDWSVANHNDGVKTEIIKAGKYKAAGHPDKAMTEEDKQTIQDEVNAYYDLFVEAVARNRGMNQADALKIANGKVFIGKKALDMGLIDGITTMDAISPEMMACHDNENKAAAGAEVVICKSCNEKISETVQGSVKCPNCKKTIDQTGAVLVEGNKIPKEEVKAMDLKELTLEALKASRPDLVDIIGKEVKQVGFEEGIKGERARVLSVIDKAKVYSDAKVEDVVRASIEGGDNLILAESKMKDKKLEALKTAAPVSPGPAEDPTRKAKTHVEVAKEYAAAHKCSLTAALEATAPKREKAVKK